MSSALVLYIKFLSKQRVKFASWKAVWNCTQISNISEERTVSIFWTATWRRTFFEKLIVRPANQKIPHLVRSPTFHYSARNCPPPFPTHSKTNPIQTPKTFFLRSVLRSTIHHLRLGLPSVLFSSGFPPKIVYSFCTLPMRATHPTLLYLIILVLITLKFDEKYKLWTSSLWKFLQPPVTSSLLGRNIPLSTLFSNTLSLCSSLNVTDQASHPSLKTTGKIRVL
jgi:hypothetical protein